MEETLFSNFKERALRKELINLRLLNVIAGILVILLGFVFEFAYHDGFILIAGICVSVIFTLNYFLSFYLPYYKRNFLNISYLSIFIVHFWAVYVAYMRQFDIVFLLPVALSTFIFSLVFDRFYKSLFFIFSVTSVMLFMMWYSHHWQADYTIAVVTLYSGAFVTNIILRRKKEYHREIGKREKTYETLVENMNDGLIYINSSNELLFANEEFCRISGYTKEELIGKDFFLLNTDPAQIESARKFAEELTGGQTSRRELKIRKKNGEEGWVQLGGSPIHNDAGEITGSMIVFTDITNLKTIQEQLKKREEGYRTFIDQSAVGIWRAEYKEPIYANLDLEKQIDLLLNTGKISECNDFMAKMYGYSKSSELIGRKIRDFYYIENNFDEEKTKELLSEFIRNGYRISNAESKEADRSGNIRFILNNNIGILENGYLVRTWGIQTDITERKKTEKDLQESNQELDTFFYKASHDLKGPLASILGIANLARLENKDPVIENYFSMIERSVRKLDRTLMDLIDLARTRKGVSKVNVIIMKNLVDEILGSLSNMPGFTRINFEINVPAAVEIVADKVLMLSVFQNLIHNAINYCSRESPWVRIQVREKNNGIELEISDNGKGIPDHVKNKVYDMFYRGHPDSSGSGLGLFIVKNALDKMNGKIRFESEAGKGTTFFVEIPEAAT